jgi:uncharacterized membrane protein
MLAEHHWGDTEVDMAILVVLFGSLLIYRGLGAVGVAALQTWLACARFALATMFLFTAIAHFTPVRKDMIAMVPPYFPQPGLLVTITGILEAAGAIGLLLIPTRPWAAWGLILLMLAMFPANVSAARRGVQLRGKAPTPLWIRTPVQIMFIAWAWWVR